MPSYFSFLLLAIVAWGAFAFGANYDWAYRPLFWACAAVGALGMWAPGAEEPKPRVNKALVVAIALLAIVPVIQLIPLSIETLTRISPATDAFLRKYDIGYRLASANGIAVPHPLSIKPAGTWLALAAIGALGCLMLGTARGLGRLSLRAFASGLVFLGFLVALEGIVQSGLFSTNAQLVPKIYGFWETVNKDTTPFGPFVNRNHFAGWMLLALPVSMGYFCWLVAGGMRGVPPTLRDRVLWFSSREASRVVTVGLAVLVMAISLVLTLSRSGTSCFVVALAISTWVVLRRQGAGSRRRLTVAYVILVAVLSIGWAGFDAVVGRFGESSVDFWSRVAIWADAWSIHRAFPWLGTGLNTFGAATYVYQTTLLEAHHVEAHNDYLQLLSEGGVMMSMLAIAAIVLLVREIRRRFAEGEDDALTYWVRVGAATGLFAIALQEVGEFSLQMPGIAALFAIVCGLAVHRPSASRA